MSLIDVDRTPLSQDILDPGSNKIAPESPNSRVRTYSSPPAEPGFRFGHGERHKNLSFAGSRIPRPFRPDLVASTESAGNRGSDKAPILAQVGLDSADLDLDVF